MPYEEEDACMSSVSQTPCRVTPPLRARAPAYDGEYYTPTLRLAMWHAFAGEEEEEDLFIEHSSRDQRPVNACILLLIRHACILLSI